MGGRVGTVTKVGFRSSTIRTTQGAEVIVPNSQFVSEQVINWSLSDELRRVEIDVGVKYGTDPREVLTLLQRVAEGHSEVLPQPPPEALFLTFGASSLDFQLQVWTARGGSWMTLRSELSIEINRLFKEAGIEIPYPQQDLNLRSVDPLVLAAMDKSSLG
jgi:potassium-dependent mechanosensitive channel